MDASRDASDPRRGELPHVKRTLARHARFEPATFGSGGRLRVPVCTADRIKNPSEPADLGAIFTDLIHIAGKIVQRSATADPDPVRVLSALARGRGTEAKADGQALAQHVLAEVLGRREVALALAVLRGGPHADHRLVDLCELLVEAGAGEGQEAAEILRAGAGS